LEEKRNGKGMDMFTTGDKLLNMMEEGKMENYFILFNPIM
jgi:hypothetical protein